MYVNMFALILYLGLIPFVVSVHFNTNDGDELDNKTIPVSKDCVLEMKENKISQIVELFNSNLVNVVVIHISFSNSSHEGQLFSDFNISLSNSIGREILHALERWQFRYFPWTLKVGIKNFKLNVKGSQNDCIKTGKNATEFVLESTQHIVDSINLATNYQVCSSFKETSAGKVDQTCCHMTKPNLATKFNYKCPKGNSFFFSSDRLWNIIYFMMYLLTHFYLMWLLLVFLSRTEFDLKYPEYYKLEESMMSPSSILLKVIWDENGRVISFFRSLVIVGTSLCFCYLSSWIKKAYIFFSIIVILVFLWVASLSISDLLKYRITNSSVILNKIVVGRNYVFQIQSLFHTFNMSWEKSNRRVLEIVVKITTLPFNPNVWRNTINMLYNKCTSFARCVAGRFRNRILKTLALFAYSVLAVLICFVFVAILVCFLITFAIGFPIAHLWKLVVLVCVLEYRTNSICSRALSIYRAAGLFSWLVFSTMIIALSMVSFLVGLFLNLIYFIPYFAFFSVLTFYCCSYWKTMEEKYFVLKRLIYEACRETQNINNGCIPNRHPKPNEEVLPVVSKELYDKLREVMLPYDTNLFHFGLKMVWSIAFSYAIFTLINMLNESNVAGLVQVVTTASLGVVPHILNMVGLKPNEERKKAWNEKLKLNVKYMVEELSRKNAALAQTVLIIEQHDETRTENLSFAHRLKYQIPGWNILNIDDVENDQQALPVMLEDNNVTTDDENTEDSEHFETMFGINCSDNGNRETSDRNGPNSENAHDNVDVIVHRSREALIDDIDSEEQLFIQLNNEMTFEENDQNSAFEYCTLS